VPKELRQRFLPTVQLSVDMMAPAPLGAWVHGVPRLLKQTSTLVFAECHIFADDVLAARASGILRIGKPFSELPQSRV
jgi:acyl-coenzyme A thioesterase PaaI-like protein